MEQESSLPRFLSHCCTVRSRVVALRFQPPLAALRRINFTVLSPLPLTSYADGV
jgi:hypothetical protein